MSLWSCFVLRGSYITGTLLDCSGTTTQESPKVLQINAALSGLSSPTSCVGRNHAVLVLTAQKTQPYKGYNGNGFEYEV
jgi:hypothetical protein